MTEKPITPGEIRKILDVTDATVRNYCNRFGEFLSPDATRKTRKRFSPADVQILQLAKSYLDDGYTYDQVINLLENQSLDDILDIEIPSPQVEKPSSPDDETNAILPAEFYKQFEIAIAAKDQTIEILLTENERLRAELAKKDRGFWDRLFRRSE